MSEMKKYVILGLSPNNQLTVLGFQECLYNEALTIGGQRMEIENIKGVVEAFDILSGDSLLSIHSWLTKNYITIDDAYSITDNLYNILQEILKP